MRSFLGFAICRPFVFPRESFTPDFPISVHVQSMNPAKRSLFVYLLPPLVLFSMQAPRELCVIPFYVALSSSLASTGCICSANLSFFTCLTSSFACFPSIGLQKSQVTLQVYRKKQDRPAANRSLEQKPTAADCMHTEKYPRKTSNQLTLCHFEATHWPPKVNLT